MKATFNNTIDILVKAYFNNTLKHGSCHACAVGNIIAGVNKIEIVNGYFGPMWVSSSPCWQNVFISDSDQQSIYLDNYDGEAKFQIDSTGYSLAELAKIERIFEQTRCDEDKEDRMFNGLMAVVDVLAKIHGVSLEQSKEAKLMFVKSC